MNPTDEQVDAAAKAMCAEVGENWLARSSNETHSGNSPEEMRDGWLNLAEVALTAAGVKPRVKPLEWTDCGGGDAYAETICGTYSIQQYASYAALQMPGQKIKDRENFAHQTDAKAAAQADYEARILSTLTTEGE